MKKEEMREKYANVECLLDDALEKAKTIQVSGDEENIELHTVVSTLEEINSDYRQEIEKLETSSEWDKYCIAFFGETNAGKSTIIESLRIIFDEEQRRAEITKSEKEYAKKLASHCEDYKKLLQSLKEINLALSKHSKSIKIMQVVKGIALLLVGSVVGFLISYLNLI